MTSVHTMVPNNWQELQGLEFNLASEIRAQRHGRSGQRVYEMQVWNMPKHSFSTTHRDTFLVLGALSLGLVADMAKWLETKVFARRRGLPAALVTWDDWDGEGEDRRSLFQVIRTVSDEEWITFHVNPAG